MVLAWAILPLLIVGSRCASEYELGSSVILAFLYGKNKVFVLVVPDVA